jgi:hypothetical protein
MRNGHCCQRGEVIVESDLSAWYSVLGNSGKPVTLEMLSLTKFSKHVFQEQETRDFRKPGTRETSNSRMREVRES